MCMPYFDWLVEQISFRTNLVTYNKLYATLFDIIYIPVKDLDRNRAEDGKSLRYEYEFRTGHSEGLSDLGQARVLEVMVSMAIRMEQNHMADDTYGDRTGWWFWDELVSLGISEEHDLYFHKDIVIQKVKAAMAGLYDQSGDGGFWMTTRKDVDMRKFQLWDQMQIFANDAHAREEERLNGFLQSEYSIP